MLPFLIKGGLAAVFCTLTAVAALAHRPGETYVYLVVDDGPLRGEVHVRETDIAFLEEFGSRAEATGAYAGVSAAGLPELFAKRLGFFVDGERRQPVFEGAEDFGDGQGRFLVFRFSVPELAPAPDALDIAFPFIFDGPNPRHRTMVLISRNARTGLSDNEALPSLVFGPGAERQTLSLALRPSGRSVSEFAALGIRQVLQSGPHLASILVLLVFALRRRDDREAQASLAHILLLSLAVAGAIAVGAGALVAADGRIGPKHLIAAHGAVAALALGLVFLRLPRNLRLALVAAAALLLGTVSQYFAGRIGLEAGRLAAPLAGFLVGGFSAVLGLALLTGALVRSAENFGRSGTPGLRLAAVVLTGAALYSIWDSSRFL